MAALQAKDFSGARKKLEKWLEDYDAGVIEYFKLTEFIVRR